MKTLQINGYSNAEMKIIHFNNGSGGGVKSVIFNLIHFTQIPNTTHEIIYTLDSEKSLVHPVVLNGEIEEHKFYFSKNWNLYHTCRKLAEFIPDGDCIIVAHDWLELAMCSLLGLKNRVVFFVHGDYDYYYSLAVRYAHVIDLYVCVAESISEKLMRLIPNRRKDIYYNRFPVRLANESRSINQVKNILFIGRCEDAKGYNLLPIIDRYLREWDISMHWTIISGGTADNRVTWTNNNQVEFLGQLNNKEVLEIIPNSDILILPSLLEGMPLSVIEAMSAGVVPIVNDIPGGLQELVVNYKTGFKIKNNQPEHYALKIKELHNNQELLMELSVNAICHVKNMFSPEKATMEIEQLFQNIPISTNRKIMKRTEGSRLDRSLIPNELVVFIRKLKKLINKLSY